MKLNYTGQSFQVEDGKRFRVPGLVIEHDCECGNHIVNDYAKQHYLSYPQMNDIETITVYCPECMKEVSFEVELTLQIKVYKE